MKYCFDGVIVVEGTNDAAFLSSFIDSIFVITNGYDLPKEEIDFLKHVQGKKIIILTDSDDAGKQIREKLKNAINTAIDVEVDIGKCNKNGKHGVAECDKDEVIKKLEQYLNKEKTEASIITLNDLQQIGIDNKEKRNYIAKEFHLGKCNNKMLLKRLMFKKISLDDIKTVMENHYGD